MARQPDRPKTVLHCSFCGQPNTAKSCLVMIRGHDSNICYKCVGICVNILMRETAKRRQPKPIINTPQAR